MHLKEWKKVAGMVRTRTVVQTRTHAQKYFQKVQKSGLGPEDLEAGLDYNSFHAAMSTFSGSKSNGGGGSASKKPRRRPEATPNNIGFSESIMPGLPSSDGPLGISPGDDEFDYLDDSVGTFGLVALHNATGDLSPLNQGGRSIGIPGTETAPAGNMATPYGYPSVANNGSTPGGIRATYASGSRSTVATGSGVRLSAVNKSRTPLPSPAACGKRKVDELSAARMMAGAHEDGSSGHVGMDRPVNGSGAVQRRRLEQYDQRTPKEPKLRLSFDLNAARGVSEKNPNLSTPGSSFISSTSKRAQDGDLGQVTEASAGLGLEGGAGLSIVNPEELRPLSPYIRGDSTSPPMTPWEGELKELEEKQRQADVFKVSLCTPKQLKNFALEMRQCILTCDEKALLDLIVAAEASINSRVDLSLTLEESVLGGAEALLPPAPRSPAHVMSIAATLNSPTGPIGETPLHLACSLKPSEDGTITNEAILSICKILLEYGASTEGTDRQGQTGLHRAAAIGLRDVGKLLINKGSAINAIDMNGDTALHIAASYSNLSFLELLADFGCNCHVRNLQSRCAIDIAASKVVCDESEMANIRQKTRQLMMSSEARHRTLILYHDDCLHHIARTADDWEGPDRLGGIIGGVKDPAIFQPYELEITDQFEKADVELLQRVHSSEYIAFVNSLSKQLQNNGDTDIKKAAVAFTPQVQKIMLGHPYGETKPTEYCDTSFSSGTLQAARRAAG